MTIHEYIQSQSFKCILIGIFITIIALIIFQAGVFIGERKASFAHRLGNSFERNFIDPSEGEFPPFGFPGGPDMPGGHGAVGEIISVALPVIVVAGPDNLEKTVVVSDTTEIREFRDSLTATDLAVGDFIVVLGTPNTDGQVEAKLIRLAPPPRDIIR